VQALAEHEDLAPAVVRRAAAVVHIAQPDGDIATRRRGFTGLIDATLKAQGYRALPAMPGADERLLRYDPALVHASCDLNAVAERLRRQMGLRLCLSGPPGTGKTEFGRWISRKLDRPLHALHASDLLSMWVGGTERAIAAAFQEAERDRAILMLDEVDSFLRQRSRAVHSWEITAVNELLTQMERYDGCFIATTNRLEDVDEAALRRFDLKICWRRRRFEPHADR
uniref:ATP-binding protein n=1 Tax=Metallibacterium scheffleri TaxID=993689 RepID=UPI0023EF7414